MSEGIKLHCWWQDEPGSMYTPLLHLQEEGDIEELTTTSHRAWRTESIGFLKEYVSKWRWNWLVSLPSFDKSIVPYFIASKLGKKTICFTSHVDWDKSVEGVDMPFGKKLWKSYLKDDNTTIVTVTPHAAEGLKEEFDIEADQVIPHAVDTDVFYPREVEEPEKPVALFVGRFVPEKNISFLIELAENNQDIDFWFCGDGELKEKVLEAEEKLDNLEYKGYVSDNDKLAEYYSKSSVLLLPSLRDGPVTENFGVVIIESMACGTPVIAYDVAGPESILDNDLLVSHESEKKFGNRMNDLIKNAEGLSRQELRKTILKKYSCEKISEEWIKILDH